MSVVDFISCFFTDHWHSALSSMPVSVCGVNVGLFFSRSTLATQKDIKVVHQLRQPYHLVNGLVMPFCSRFSI